MMPRIGKGIRQWGAALALTGMAVVLRWALDPWLGERLALVTVYGAVVIAAWSGGVWPAAVTAVVGYVACDLLFIPPRGKILFGEVHTHVGLLAYLLSCSIIIVFSHRMRVTHRRLEAERARVEHSDEFHAAIADLTSDFAFRAHVNDDGMTQLDAVTDGFAKLVGYTLDELNARGGWMSVVHPDDVPRALETTRRLLTGQKIDGEIRCLRPDGSMYWVRYRSRPLTDSAGRVISIYGAAQDVTAQRLAERAIRESEARFRQIADAAPVFIWTSDAQNRLTWFNRAWLEFVGRPLERELGEGWLENVHPDDRDRVMNQDAEAVAAQRPVELEYRLRRHDGQYRWVLDRGVPVVHAGETGEFTGYIGSATDVHDRRTVEENLKNADRQKDEFLATLAHELRNPLAPIAGAVELLGRDGVNDVERQEARDIIDRQVRQLARLVDDLLDVSRITRGIINIRKSQVPLERVITDAVEASRPLIDSARHELTVSLPPGKPVMLDADATRLSQVFLNLLNNAAKYTPVGGRIRLSATREESGDAVVVRIEDNGIGIAREMLPRVFDMFTRVDHSPERAHGGLGIGLALSRRLVEMHGGTIAAQSAGPGAGSAFDVRLPILAEDLASQHALGGGNGKNAKAVPDPGAVGRRRVLVVDDNADAARMLARLLTISGNAVETANDGQEALAAAESFRPDTILLDIGMPKLSGYDVAQRIRQQPWGKSMELIALTGWGQDEDRRRTAEAGFDHHLVKPVDFAVLEGLLSIPEQP